MSRIVVKRGMLIWCALVAAIAVPIILAAMSPLLAWRQPIYILGGFAGIIAMALLFLQPILAGGWLPGLGGKPGRRLHRWIGTGLVIMVILHVVGLWITSPPDMIDALTFTSPTPFSAWGVVAMWAAFGAALLAANRQNLRWSLRRWRLSHAGLATVTVIGSIVHAMLIEGAMETTSKAALCALVLAATAKLMIGFLRKN